MQAPPEPTSVLIEIKLLHTAVWAFFAGCILAIPLAAARGRFGWVAVLSGLVLLECAVLAFNRCHCPLTDLAARHTGDRAPNFDIYLPEWLARYNREIFGALFVLGEAFALFRWLNR